MGLYIKLLNVQAELKAPKGQYNSFGKYSYRNCEDILEAVKPLLKKNGLALTITDEIVVLGQHQPTVYERDKAMDTTGSQRFYVKATAEITDVTSGEIHSVSAYAREEENKKGMDGSQITGSASSYARKYALNGLFAIDDTKDADTEKPIEKPAEAPAKAPTKVSAPPSTGKAVCTSCSKEITPAEISYSKKVFGKPLCMDCQKKEAANQKPAR